MEWTNDGTIKIVPPKNPKKITGTRLAAILGLNKWSTPFEAWCEITRTYQKPFEDTIYTIAGKTIEPKQAEYVRKAYFLENFVTPTSTYGEDYFKKTYGDFFHDEPIFGGMWDYLSCDENGEVDTVLEMKTTKRAEDWENDVPEYYALQAALYAYLLGVDKVLMVCSFLEDKDYKDPSAFVPSPKNTIIVPFRLSERYPNFSSTIIKAKKWWQTHVVGGVSPKYDEKADAEILKELRTNTLNPETDITEVIKEAEDLQKELDTAAQSIKEKEQRLKTLKDIIKEHAIKQFRDGDKKVSIHGNAYDWTVSYSESVGIDKDALKADGLLDKYNTKVTSMYKLTNKAVKES